MSGAGRGRGELAILLHTHMPYVEGFGTWPFGEEWLWEAMATSYLPLLELLRGGAAVTLSLTPVLCDQLEAPGVGDRFEAFLRDVRRETHQRDAQRLRAEGQDQLARELERSAAEYEQALERHRALPGGLLGALAPFARWTSAATHAVLPLLASEAGVRLQLRSGIDAHRARFGGWGGGLWLPECAHECWLDPLLDEAGARATCLDLTDRLGLGSLQHLRPLRSEAGVTLAPIDRATVDLVWGARGYPSHPRYRDYYALTPFHHRAWANDGSPYDHAAALAQAREHAADFVAQAQDRLERYAEQEGGPGLVVCALDTELLGHWWYEGIAWLGAVIEEADRQGLALADLDDALARRDPRPISGWGGATSWGEGRDLSTWSGPAVADLAWAARAAELSVLGSADRVTDQAARQLLALQASDWAFLVSRQLAPPYGRERARLHREALDRALAGERLPDELMRNLGVHATRAALLAP